MALADNIISYWKLDEASGNAADSVGALTLTNNNSVPYGTGKINNGAVFNNGTTQSLSSGGPAFGAAGTIAFWFFAPTGYDGGYFHDADASNRYYHYINGDGSSATSFNGTTMPAFTAGGIVTNAWTHVVMTWDNSLGSNKQALYKNGTLYANTNNAISASTPASWYLGNRYSNTGTFDALQGTLDEFGVWTRALSSTEVTELYNGGAGFQYPFTSNNGAGFFMLMA